MYTGRKVILTKPAESDAKTLQKWYLDKDFRYWYDSYVSNSLDMIVDDIKNGRDITDPGAKKIVLLYAINATMSPSASPQSRISTAKTVMRK